MKTLPVLHVNLFTLTNVIYKQQALRAPTLMLTIFREMSHGLYLEGKFMCDSVVVTAKRFPNADSLDVLTTQNAAGVSQLPWSAPLVLLQINFVHYSRIQKITPIKT